jgi:hypothetical protein
MSNIKKIIIWGDKLFKNEIPVKLEDELNHSLHDLRGTFSYIYYGFYRAFHKLNYNVFWFDHYDNLEDFNFDNSLIIAYNNTIRVNVEKFPIKNNCYYVLHNVYFEPYYKELFKYIPTKNIIHYLLPIDKAFNNIDTGIIYYKNRFNFGKYIDNFGYIMINMWATDLLPDEIKEINKKILSNDNEINEDNQNTIYFVGTIEHNDSLKRMKKIFQDNKVEFNLVGGVNRNVKTMTILENINYTKKSKLSIAVQNSEQIRLEYCPCRIFKSISYGFMPLSNNKVVLEVIDPEMIYDEDLNKLYKKGIEFKKKINKDKNKIMKRIINKVMNEHTFISRSKSIIEYFVIINS